MGVYDWAKDALKIAQTANRMDLYEKLTALIKHVNDLQDENTKVKSENAELQAKLKLRDEYVFDKNKSTYFRKKDDGTIEGPFCPSCKHKSSMAVPMGWSELSKQHTCPVCGFEDDLPTITIPLMPSDPANKRIF